LTEGQAVFFTEDDVASAADGPQAVLMSDIEAAMFNGSS
jgi:hypothetical protein